MLPPPRWRRVSTSSSYTSDIIPPVAATQHLPAVIHNLQGQRLATMQKGNNIVAGKKILVK